MMDYTVKNKKTRMNNLMKNERGITLLALVVSVIILMILAGAGTTLGKSSIESAKLTTFGTEMQAMQTKVNELNQQYKDGDNSVLYIGSVLLGSSQETKAFSGANVADLRDYRYYSKSTLESIGLGNFNQEFLVNVKTRSAISLDGIKYKDKTIWTIEQLDDSTFNVDFGGIDSIVTFGLDVKDNGLLVSNIQYVGDVKKCKIYCGQGSSESTVKWKLLASNVSETSYKIDKLSNDGVWYVKVEDSAGHSATRSITVYTVNFNANGGSVGTSSKKVAAGGTYGDLPTPSRAGYTFLGWNGKNLFDFGNENDYWKYESSNITFDITEKSISDIKSNGWAGDYWRNEKNYYSTGNYVVSAVFEGDTLPRHIIFLYDSSDNQLTNNEINLSNAEWNDFYQGWMLRSPYSISIPSNVSYWKYGSAFNGTEGKSCKIHSIQIEEGTTATEYEPFIINNSTPITQTKSHTLKAIWKKN